MVSAEIGGHPRAKGAVFDCFRSTKVVSGQWAAVSLAKTYNASERLTTDKLPSYGAAVRELGIERVHRTDR
jgi:hypothetical protein